MQRAHVAPWLAYPREVSLIHTRFDPCKLSFSPEILEQICGYVVV